MAEEKVNKDVFHHPTVGELGPPSKRYGKRGREEREQDGKMDKEQKKAKMSRRK